MGGFYEGLGGSSPGLLEQVNIKFRVECSSLPNYSPIQLPLKRKRRSKKNPLTAFLLNVKGLSQDWSLDLYACQASIEIPEGRSKLSLIVKMKDSTPTLHSINAPAHHMM